MGVQVSSWGCCQSSGSQNSSEEHELKKTDTSEKYPKALNSSKPPSNEYLERSYIYAPDGISSIEYNSYSDESSSKEIRQSQRDNKLLFLNATSLHTIEEISNSEIHDFFPSELLDTQEILKGNFSTSENISKVLEMKLSDSFSFEDLEFDEKLKNCKINSVLS